VNINFIVNFILIFKATVVPSIVRQQQ